MNTWGKKLSGTEDIYATNTSATKSVYLPFEGISYKGLV
jgi:hypothetical protein